MSILALLGAFTTRHPLIITDAELAGLLDIAVAESTETPLERARRAKQAMIDDERAEIDALETRIINRNAIEAQAKLVFDSNRERIAEENEQDRQRIAGHLEAIAEIANTASPTKKGKR